MGPARVKYVGLALALVAMTALVACAQTAPRNPPTATPQPTNTPVPPTPTPVPEPTATPTPSPTPEPTATPTPTIEPSPTPSPTPAGSPTAIPVSNVQTYGLSLEIEGISDESEVFGDSIVLVGQTSPGATVSVNGVIIPVDDTGAFEVPLMLNPGPNLIQVVASDLDGNQVPLPPIAVFSHQGEAV